MVINQKKASWENEHSSQERGSVALYVSGKREAEYLQQFSEDWSSWLF